MKCAFLPAFIALVLLALPVDADLSEQLQEISGATPLNATVCAVGSGMLNITTPAVVVPENINTDFLVNLTVTNNGTCAIDVKLNRTGDPSATDTFTQFVILSNPSVRSNEKTVTLAANSTETSLGLRVFVPAGKGYNGGTFNETIFAFSLTHNVAEAQNLTVRVNNSNPIDDILVQSIAPLSISSGETISAVVHIQKLSPPGTTDITIEYRIIPQSQYIVCQQNSLFVVQTETRAITTILNFTKTLTITKDPDDYVLEVAVKYPTDDKPNCGSNTFTVSGAAAEKTAAGGGGGGGTVIAPVSEEETSPAGMALALRADAVITILHGESDILFVEVTNTGNETIDNVTLHLFGLPPPWFTVFPVIPQILQANETVTFRIDITIPHDLTYEGSFTMLIAVRNHLTVEQEITLITAKTEQQQAALLLQQAVAVKERLARFAALLKQFGIDIAAAQPVYGRGERHLIAAETFAELGSYATAIAAAEQSVAAFTEAEVLLSQQAQDQFFAHARKLEAHFRDREETLDEELRVLIITALERAQAFFAEGKYAEAYQELLQARTLLAPSLFGVPEVVVVGIIAALLAVILLLFRKIKTLRALLPKHALAELRAYITGERYYSYHHHIRKRKRQPHERKR